MPTPFLVGIDLGTTNCALAYVDARRHGGESWPRVRRFAVPQLVAPREMAPGEILPSFLYFGTADEQASGALALPWNPAAAEAVGTFARDHGALTPSRQVSSAKSWLAHGGIDRTAPILPFGHEPEEPGISPVAASARYLVHLREAWNHTMAAGAQDLRLQAQQVVLTVPASFDEEARELTMAAAAEAGLEHVVLLEEPIAATYAWIGRMRGRAVDRVGPGSLLLVCDVGGGTSDFSLIRAADSDDESSFERVAVGEHLLLGGDNLDLALAVLVEERLGLDRLSLARRQSLRRQCAAAKERLLSGGEEVARITVLGGGRAVVGGAVAVDLTRAEVLDRLLEGFLPLVEADDRPARDRRRGLRELGLPYEPEPAITRHLAAFLAQGHEGAALARPDAVLFNGGFFTPEPARTRMVETLARWFGAPPAVLVNEHPESAVAIGAAFYAGLRALPGAARSSLVRAASPRTYYIGVDSSGEPSGAIRALTILPRGTDEGAQLGLPDRRFHVATNRAVRFTLYSSTTRQDPHGAVVTLEADDAVHRHAPLATVLRFGKRSRQSDVDVTLHVRYTELGALEVWLQAIDTPHRWRLQFQVRGTVGIEEEEAAPADAGTDVVVSDEAVADGVRAIRAVFAGEGTGPPPLTLVADLEAILGYGKQAWPIGALRAFADVLLEHPAGRLRGPAYEARWLNLAGFCLRPGFGAAADQWRIGEIRKIYTAGLAFDKEVQNQVEWLVLWQRVAGGFSAGQQGELARRIVATLGLGAKKGHRLNAQIERESWRLLATLERLELQLRMRIGDELDARVKKEPRNASLVWALGRLGARVPFYGPLDRVVPAERAGSWLETLLSLREITPDAAAAIAQVASPTGDPARDLEPALRDAALDVLRARGADPELVRELTTIGAADRLAQGMRYFGESLPNGLRLVE